jgi:D-arabinose 1-dehydrogenase-like Zn-dependent alcohol dehydrogenase
MEHLMKIKSIIVKSALEVVYEEEEINALDLRPNEVFIESLISIISPGTELSRVFGLKKGATYPVRPGYCTVGKVLGKGSEVNKVDLGDTVLTLAPHGSHHIYDGGSHKEKVLYKLDPRLSPKEGAMIVMCWIALNGILPVDVKPFDTVVIFGMGNLGIFLAIYYKQMGVKVIGVDPVEHRCAVARSCGIETVLSCEPKDQAKMIIDLTKQKGADIVVDATGLSPVVETAIEVAAKNAQVVLLGSPRSDYTTNVTPLLNAIHMRNIKVIGALNQLYPFEEKEGSRISQRRGMDYITELMIEKIIDVDKFISHIVKPEDIMSAYDGLMNHKEIYTSVLVDWTK